MTPVREFVVPESLDGARVDKAALALATPVLSATSRAQMKRAIEDGAVRVNGKRRPKGALVAAGEVITIAEAAVPGKDGPASPEPNAPLVVRYSSSDLLVVDKPAGQASAPLRDGEGGTLANALVGHYPELAGVGYSPREPGLVHRLDTDTSGLLVVARNAGAFEALKGALKADRLHKTYLLVCRQADLPDLGTIELPLASHPKDQRRVYPCVHARDVVRYSPRPAKTTYEVVRRGEVWALVEVAVARALRHQIRAHFAAIEHPLAGDTLYGGEAVPSLSHHALHASRVAFDDDKLGFDVTSPAPQEMTELASR